MYTCIHVHYQAGLQVPIIAGRPGTLRVPLQVPLDTLSRQYLRVRIFLIPVINYEIYPSVISPLPQSFLKPHAMCILSLRTGSNICNICRSGIYVQVVQVQPVMT